MILINKKDYQEVAKDLLANRFSSEKYTILNMKYVGHAIDRKRFDLTIELLNLANFYNKVIIMFEGMGLEKKIDTGIIYEAIDHVFKEKPFSDSQLIRYYELGKEFETIVDSMGSLLSEEDYYASYDIDFVLLGSKLETIFDAENTNADKVGDIHEKFGNLVWEMKNDRKTTKELIKEVKEIVKNGFKEIEKHIQ